MNSVLLTDFSSISLIFDKSLFELADVAVKGDSSQVYDNLLIGLFGATFQWLFLSNF